MTFYVWTRDTTFPVDLRCYQMFMAVGWMMLVQLKINSSHVHTINVD